MQGGKLTCCSSHNGFAKLRHAPQVPEAGFPAKWIMSELLVIRWGWPDTSGLINTSRLTIGCRFVNDRPPRGGLSRIERFAAFATLSLPCSFEPRSRLFGSHLARIQAGTTSVRGCCRSRRLLLPYASRRNAPTQAG